MTRDAIDAELWALLDDELPPAAAAALRGRIAADPALAACYRELDRFDEGLREAAAAAAFEPAITLRFRPSAATTVGWPAVAALAAALVLVRLLPKLASLATIGVALQAFAGAALLVVVTRLVREGDVDRATFTPG